MEDSHDTKLHVVVIGPMGSGKTTLGVLLAEALACDFLDSDTELEARHGRTGTELAATFGVRHLHELELNVFQDMVLRPERAVVAAAESVVDTDTGRDLLVENMTIWVDATPDTLLERRKESDHRREMPRAELMARRTSRADALRHCSTIRIDTTTDTPQRCLTAALEALGGGERP